MVMKFPVLIQLIRICSLAMAGIAFGLAMLATERWAIMLLSFVAGANIAGVGSVTGALRMRKRIKEQTDSYNRMNQASMMLRYSLSDSWDSTEEQPVRSEYDRWMH
jgi:hypothetical protein